MDVHASPDELPELQEFLGRFPIHCRRLEGAEALERYATGPLSELPNRNGDTLAPAVPGARAQRLQEFLTNMQWDEADLNRQRVQRMSAEATLGDGVLAVDATGFPKQGQVPAGGRARARAPWARWAMARSRSPVVIPLRRRCGRWPCSGTCRSPRRAIRGAGTRRACQTGRRFRPRWRRRWG